jgi:hypothetical protein
MNDAQAFWYALLKLLHTWLQQPTMIEVAEGIDVEQGETHDQRLRR